MFVNKMPNPDNVRKYDSVSRPLPAEPHQIWPNIFKPVSLVSRALLEENCIAAETPGRSGDLAMLAIFVFFRKGGAQK